MGGGASSLGSSTTAAEVAALAEAERFEGLAVVTGANSGIGKETVKVLAQHGMPVVMACECPKKAAPRSRSVRRRSE